MKSKRAREAVEAEDKHVTPVDVEAAPPKKRKRNDDADAADVKKKAKKDKKHKKESRKERKDKRKDLQDLPDQDDEVVDEAGDSPMADADVKPASATADAAAEPDKKKKDKKDKKEEPQEEEPSADAEVNGESKKKKKKKKSKKDKKPETSETTDNNNNEEAGAEDADTAADSNSNKADRHIVFVGNLPFTATAASIKAHFASLSPSGVRCMSDPNEADTKPCRGFAFVEFAKVWHMRTCLDKFHHSMFDDGISPARRINVELTAGGGGKTKHRKEKIQEKNRKLNENRTKRIERERNAKDEARANGGEQQHHEDAIHPSRRGRVPGNAW